MKSKLLILLLLVPMLCLAETKKKVVYQKHTQLDFSGETVSGKIKIPAVYYIFQRKRSPGHHVVYKMENFDHHRGDVIEHIKEITAP